MSVQSDYRSSPNTNRKETRGSLGSGPSSRLNRLQLLDNGSIDFPLESQNGNEIKKYLS